MCPHAGYKGVEILVFLSPKWGNRVPSLPLPNGSMTWLPPSRPERAVFRLRKWIVLRLVSMVNSLHMEKEEALIEEVAR